MASTTDTEALRRLTGEITGDLERGVSVMITGLPRSGRSHLIGRVAEDLSRLGTHILRFRGSTLLADRALSAVSLGGVSGDENPSSGGGSPLVRAASALEAGVARANTVLVVDDAESLDRVSAGVIADVVARRAVPLLLACRCPQQPSGVVLELVAAAQPGVSVALTGMPLEDVMRLTNHLLGGVVGADTIARVATLSGGLPGLIEAIVDAGRRSGQLTSRDGVWQTTGDLWDASLEFSLLPFVQGLDSDEVQGLRRLAVAGDISRDAAEELVGPATVFRLVQEGLVVCPDRALPAGELHVFPPLLAEWLRRAEGDVAGRGGASGAWPVTLTRPEVAALADQFRMHWRTEVERCWGAWEADRTPLRAVPLLVALFATSAADDTVMQVFDKTESDEASPHSARFFAVRATHRAIWRGDLAGALAELEELRRVRPQWDTYLRGLEARLRLVRDRVPDDSLLKLPVAPDGADLGVLRVARIEAMIAQGRVADAQAELTRLLPYNDSCRIARQTLGALTMVVGDDVEGGVALAVAGLREAVVSQDCLAISGYAYVTAFGLWTLGRFAEIESLVEVVHRLADTSLFQNHFKAGLLLLGSMVAQVAGRGPYAGELAAQAWSLGAGPGPFPAMCGPSRALPTPPIATGQLWDVVDELMDRHFVAAAVWLAEAAAEQDPAPQRAAAVVAAGRASQSRLLRCLARYLEAMVAGDLTRFEPIVADLRRSLGPVEATRALVTWALALRRAGDTGGWLRQAGAAWRESAHITRPCAGLFARLIDAVDLTVRETEVVGYVTQGLSSPAIAATLGVSSRTVEAYLHAIYRKTGVGNRDELRHLARTWLSVCAPSQSADRQARSKTWTPGPQPLAGGRDGASVDHGYESGDGRLRKVGRPPTGLRVRPYHGRFGSRQTGGDDAELAHDDRVAHRENAPDGAHGERRGGADAE